MIRYLEFCTIINGHTPREIAHGKAYHCNITTFSAWWMKSSTRWMQPYKEVDIPGLSHLCFLLSQGSHWSPGNTSFDLKVCVHLFFNWRAQNHSKQTHQTLHGFDECMVLLKESKTLNGIRVIYPTTYLHVAQPEMFILLNT